MYGNASRTEMYCRRARSLAAHLNSLNALQLGETSRLEPELGVEQVAKAVHSHSLLEMSS